jgi:hypothetical protein
VGLVGFFFCHLLAFFRGARGGRLLSRLNGSFVSWHCHKNQHDPIAKHSELFS